MKREEVNERFCKDVAVEFIAMILFIWIGTGAAVSTGEFLALSSAPDAATVRRQIAFEIAFENLQKGIEHQTKGIPYG